MRRTMRPFGRLGWFGLLPTKLVEFGVDFPILRHTLKQILWGAPYKTRIPSLYKSVYTGLDGSLYLSDSESLWRFFDLSTRIRTRQV